MEIETLNNRTLYIRNNKFLNSPIFPYDLPKLIKKMQDTSGWKNGELAATILLKSANKQIILTLLHNDTQVNSFQSGDSVTFQMIEGSIELHTPAKTVLLNEGHFLTLHDKIKFSITSLEDSIFLLTLLNAH